MAIFGAYLIALAVALLCRKKIEETLAPAIIGMVLVVYTAGRAGVLGAGVIAVYILFVVSFVWIVYKFITERDTFKGALFTWGCAALVFYTLFFAYYSFHRDFSHPDELYCWGLLAKNYYAYGAMKGWNFTALAGDQTPFMPLLFYLSGKSWLNFSDSICYLNHNILVISLVLPVFVHFRSRLNALRTMMVILILPSMLVLSGLDGFWYALSDIVLAAGMCFFIMNTIAHIQTDDRYYYVVGILNIAAMCLVKRMGVLFASLMIVCVVSIYMGRGRRGIYNLVGYALAGVIVEFTWSGFDKYIVLPILGLAGGLGLYAIGYWLKQVSVEDRIRELIHIVIIMGSIGALGVVTLKFLCIDAYGYGVVARSLGELFMVSTEDGFIKLAYGIYVLILLVFLYVLKSSYGEVLVGEDSLDIYRELGLSILISMILYFIFNLYVHITQTGPINDYKERIVPRYIIPWEILVIFLIFYIVVVRMRNLNPVILICTFIIIVLVSDTGTLYKGMFEKHRCIGYTALQDAGIEVQTGDLVYFIDEQNYFSYTDREFYYHIFPAKSNFIDQIFHGNKGRIEMTLEELTEAIACDKFLRVPYDYLYLQTYDDDFIERYGTLFEDEADIAPGSAFYVETDGTEVMLKRIRRDGD